MRTHNDASQGVARMMVMTMRAKVKWVVFGVLTVTGLVLLALILFFGARGERYAIAADMKYSLVAGDEAERIAFAAQFGWQVNEEPVEVEEVVIPAEFNAVYENYNDIQQAQGLDLTAYAGKPCKRWVYQVLNYPREGDVRITLLVYDGLVIGGDVSSASLNGFMVGFLGEHGLMSQPAEDAAVQTEDARETAVIPDLAYPTD